MFSIGCFVVALAAEFGNFGSLDFGDFDGSESIGLDDADAIGTTGRRFRDTVLSLGGSQHPMEVFTAFRGREPDPAALLRHNGLVAAK